MPCGKRIKFGKISLKCRDCRVVSHPECRERCPLPCIPNLGGTPVKIGEVCNTIFTLHVQVDPLKFNHSSGCLTHILSLFFLFVFFFSGCSRRLRPRHITHDPSHCGPLYQWDRAKGTAWSECYFTVLILCRNVKNSKASSPSSYF